MPRKLNCWEFKNCGREPGGLMAETLGVCPVASKMKFDGQNGGVAAGRTCWMIPESGCRVNPGRYKVPPCHSCEFYRRVVHEEADQVCYKYHTVEA